MRDSSSGYIMTMVDGLRSMPAAFSGGSPMITRSSISIGSVICATATSPSGPRSTQAVPTGRFG